MHSRMRCQSSAQTTNTTRILLLVITKKCKKHTTEGIRWWSPTQLLTSRRVA
ncbi:hypothetical protein BO66DRAFT_242094 [Aspergillus aculeatinus CBS 121060]|uniref:Uncharacterized protein n=1 Tax=Aspergillus aculeatinus CBS 121060 TaxID=1448322 RepID=A0ACD1GSS0_9EURO|nr:hypothetical protein BO66DRAFT_242094 [Aspergillus aculeatinus CBS 121060]RAH64368.1 hypothetical protein BO66DRAFT_242094 [Aspergillus aculeatinus CBS 121060]